MVFGTFDIVHAGHLRMFKEAIKYGDKLVAVVARDKNVKRVKGIGALHNENERLDFLQNISIVDEVILGDNADAYRAVKDMKPDIIALGYDQKEYVDKLAETINKAGLKCGIVRLPPYQNKRLKSSKIKKYIERLV